MSAGKTKLGEVVDYSKQVNRWAGAQVEFEFFKHVQWAGVLCFSGESLAEDRSCGTERYGVTCGEWRAGVSECGGSGLGVQVNRGQVGTGGVMEGLEGDKEDFITDGLNSSVLWTDSDVNSVLKVFLLFFFFSSVNICLSLDRTLLFTTLWQTCSWSLMCHTVTMTQLWTLNTSVSISGLMTFRMFTKFP